MKILLGSLNPLKKKAVELALEDLKIDAEILCFNAKSHVDSKPIGYEIVRGAENRNADLVNIAKKNNIEYDYLCSIEGGYSLDENGLPFVVTYAVVQDKSGKNSTGKSLGIRLRKEFFQYVRSGKSLNQLIEKLNNSQNNKQTNGITGFLTNNLLTRAEVDKQAVVSALVPFVFKDNFDALTNAIKNGNVK